MQIFFRSLPLCLVQRFYSKSRGRVGREDVNFREEVQKMKSIYIAVPRTCTSLSLVDGRGRWNSREEEY